MPPLKVNNLSRVRLVSVAQSGLKYFHIFCVKYFIYFLKYFPHLAGDIDSLAGTDRSEDWSELDAESGLVLLGRRPVGLQHLVGGLASDWSTPCPAVLCHKDTARGNQSPLRGAFLAFHRVFMA